MQVKLNPKRKKKGKEKRKEKEKKKINLRRLVIKGSRDLLPWANPGNNQRKSKCNDLKGELSKGGEKGTCR